LTHNADPREIEHDIERDRARLASTLDALKDRVSIDTLAQDALGLLRSNTAGYTHSIDQAVRANPLALALVGAGLAWLVFGQRPAPEAVKPKNAALMEWENDGGPARPSDEHTASWTDHSDNLRSRAAAALRRLETEAREATGGLRDFAQDRAAVLADFTVGLKQSFGNGLDDLTDVARDRIVAAREAAYAARLKVERMARAAPQTTGRMIEDHPMVTGAVLLALGAALGAALPRTRIEDRAFGAESDRLMAMANRVLDDERAALGRVATDIGADLADGARSAVQAVKETARDMADRVAEKIA